ncbi:MAG: hypothetical protein KAR11_05315 [Phycisphaerae bacterium]|nr:hypothetical protein [Phycisphaerae bacterium]
MKRENCWEMKKCGRQPGGEEVDEFGACPAARSSEYDGINGGLYSGRFCWMIPGTFCDGKSHGSLVEKLAQCLKCEFFRQVSEEENRRFIMTPKDIDKLSEPYMVDSSLD